MKPGTEAVHADAVAAELHRHRPGELEHAALRRVVVREAPPPRRARSWTPCSRSTPAPRATIRRATAWATRNIPRRFTCRIRSHSATSISRNAILARDPRVVDEDVDRSERGLGRLDEPRDVVLADSRRTSRRRPTRAARARRRRSDLVRVDARRTRRGSLPRGTGGRSPCRCRCSRRRRARPCRVRPRIARPPSEPSRARRASIPCRTCAGWWQTRHGPARRVRHHRGLAA